jgi:hypothetical protein
MSPFSEGKRNSADPLDMSRAQEWTRSVVALVEGGHIGVVV